uniref:Uncharacterized protein n=1 Tax=Opuntia streptacantha TaxID=393608 RepID=A0A7C8YHL1_OPUST
MLSITYLLSSYPKLPLCFPFLSNIPLCIFFTFIYTIKFTSSIQNTTWPPDDLHDSPAPPNPAPEHYPPHRQMPLSESSTRAPPTPPPNATMGATNEITVNISMAKTVPFPMVDSKNSKRSWAMVVNGMFETFTVGLSFPDVGLSIAIAGGG